MTREKAINYLYSSGFSEEQVNTIAKAFEPTTKNDLGVDCISRADAIKAMQDKAKELKNEATINGLCGAVAILYEMPSVTPQEPCVYYDAFNKTCRRSEVPQEPILGKIRAEIEEMTPTYHNPDWSITDLVPISEVLKLIDKYEVESEET